MKSHSIILKSAIRPRPKAQDFESELLSMGAEHSQTVKAAPIESYSGSKDRTFWPVPIAVSRIIVHKIILLFVFNLLPLWIHATIDWHTLTEEMYQTPEAYDLEVIGGGASNSNYHLVLDGCHYFIRFAPPTTELLDADIEVEYQVLQSLSELHVSPQPIYFNKDRRILVMEFVQNDKEEIDLLDPLIRRKVISLLHQIENSEISISRVYQPYRDIAKHVETVNSLGDTLPEVFNKEVLPALKRIDEVLSKMQNRKLCHFDLHHQNILKSNDRFWIIDWEYATMSDPFLTLGSMASIERWNDQQMENLLKEYMQCPKKEDFYRLYLYRIVADIHWVAWNHIQINLSTIDIPYEMWGKLFLDAAVARIRSPHFLEAMLYFQNNSF